MKCFSLVCVALLLTSAAVAQNQFVYTNNNVSTGTNQKPVNSVSAFKIDADGSLTQIKGSPYATGGTGGGSNIDPEEIAIATQGTANFLYAANNGTSSNVWNSCVINVAISPLWTVGNSSRHRSIAAVNRV